MKPFPGAAFLLVFALQVTDAAATDSPWNSTVLPGRPSRTGSGQSFTPVVSADGHRVVFVSQAKGLTTNGVPSPYLDVFVRDPALRGTYLVSVNTNGLGGGEGNSNFPTVSSNGQFVVFESLAANLTPHDANRANDVFVRDLATGATTLVSVGSNGVASASGSSLAPLISADGRRVVFESVASDIAPNDSNLATDLFLRDLVAGTTTLVSVNSTGTGTPNQSSDSASISADGRYVAFRSFAANIVTTSNTLGEVFVRDVDGAITHWASAGVGAYFTNTAASWRSFSPVINADGRFVAFLATVLDGGPPGFSLFRYDRANEQLARVSASASNLVPEISADGRFIAYQTADALLLADVENGTVETVCAAGVAVGVEFWGTPVLSADGNLVCFLGGATEEGPWSLYAYTRGTGARELVSLTTNGAAANVLGVSLPAVSADGSRVAYESVAADITAEDRNGVADIFLHDRTSHATQLVSERAPGLGATTPMGRSILTPRSVSEYGRFIAFTSFDNTLVDDDGNPWVDAFVRDMLRGTNQLLRLPGPSPLGSTRLALNPILSTNGRYVAWLEVAVPSPTVTAVPTNIFWLDRESGAFAMIHTSGSARNTPGPAMSGDGRWLAFVDKLGPYTDVFVRDMFSPDATNRLVSVNRFGTGGGSGDSRSPSFSSDGGWIAFQSKASDLTTNAGPSGYWQIFTRNLPTSRTRLIVRNAAGGDFFSTDLLNPVFSGNSRYMAFETSSRFIYRQDLHSTNLSGFVCQSCGNPSLSEDGRFIAYDSRESASTRNVCVQDFVGGGTTLLSSGGGIRNSFLPQIGANGRYTVFTSYTTNGMLTDTNQLADVFVHDRAQRATLLLSQSRVRPGSGDGASLLPVLAPDGRTVVFTTFASDIVSGDFNNNGDVVVLRLGGPDADADGLDDDWEVAYFNTLDRDGSGDFDGDGASDREEFRAGTNPTDHGSILRALVTSSLNGTTRVIFGIAQPGRTYRVQFKRDVSDADWTYLPGTVTATAATASQSDLSAATAPRRFYRVLLEP